MGVLPAESSMSVDFHETSKQFQSFVFPYKEPPIVVISNHSENNQPLDFGLELQVTELNVT